MGKHSSFAPAFHRNRSRALRVCLGHRRRLPCHFGFTSLGVTERWKPKMEMLFPMPGGCEPLCCLGPWASAPHHECPALLELQPQGLDCRWSIGAILHLSPLDSIPSGRKCRPWAARSVKDMVHPYLNWKMLEWHSQPSGFSIRLFHREPLKSGSDPGSLVRKGRGYWPSISDFSFLWSQEYHRSLLRVTDQPTREKNIIQRRKLL